MFSEAGHGEEELFTASATHVLSVYKAHRLLIRVSHDDLETKTEGISEAPW